MYRYSFPAVGECTNKYNHDTFISINLFNLNSKLAYVWSTPMKVI